MNPIGMTTMILSLWRRPWNTITTITTRKNQNYIMRIVNIIMTMIIIIMMMNDHIVVVVNAASAANNNNNNIMGNSETMDRVYERIDGFMKVPIETISRLSIYRSLGHGFLHGMTSPDRTMIMNFLYTELVAKGYDGTVLYFALEDGSFFYSADPYNADSREPGQAGYDVTNMTKEDRYYKNYISCIDESGNQANCTLNVGDSYIECVNECEFIECPTTYNNNAAANNNMSSSSSPTKLCRNYIVQQVQENESKGYIPDTFICIDVNGQPTQEIGKVWKSPPPANNDTTDSTIDVVTSAAGVQGIYGNCYYDDGITLVNRSLYGTYASCRTNVDVYGGCDNAFVGGYSSPEYDARYRDWYVNTKIAQEPIWTSPYLFSILNVMGITYSQPIYSANGNTNDAIIFDGVIAVDYYLESINQFLITYYANTNLQVFIVELNEPTNYFIASSKFNGQVTKWVSSFNNDMPCPSELNTTDCTLERVSIKEYKNSIDIEDVVLYRAYMTFEAHDAILQQRYSPNTTVTFFKIHDIIGSPAYIGQRKLYQQGTSLNWYIYVIRPMTVSTTDAVTPGDSSFIIVLLLGIGGFVGCSILLHILLQYRKEKAMVHADWRFTAAFIAGCASMNISTLTLVGENTNATCLLRMWSFNGLFVCALSPLFVKVWRMHRLLTFGVQRSNLNHYQAILLTLPLIMMEIILLTIFTLVDPPRQTEHLGTTTTSVTTTTGSYTNSYSSNSNDANTIQNQWNAVQFDDVYQSVTCEQQTNSFFITQFSFDAFLVLMGCILAYQTRDLDPKFGEAKQLGFSMYNVAFTGLVVTAIVKFVSLDQETITALRAIGVLWGSFFCSCAFVIPRWLEIRKERQIYAALHGTSSGFSSRFNRVKSYFTTSRASTVDNSRHGGKKKNLMGSDRTNTSNKSKPDHKPIDDSDDINNNNNSSSNVKGSSNPTLSSSSLHDQKGNNNNWSTSFRLRKENNKTNTNDASGASSKFLTWDTNVEVSGVSGVSGASAIEGATTIEDTLNADIFYKIPAVNNNNNDNTQNDKRSNDIMEAISRHSITENSERTEFM